MAHSNLIILNFIDATSFELSQYICRHGKPLPSLCDPIPSFKRSHSNQYQTWVRLYFEWISSLFYNKKILPAKKNNIVANDLLIPGIDSAIYSASRIVSIFTISIAFRESTETSLHFWVYFILYCSDFFHLRSETFEIIHCISSCTKPRLVSGKNLTFYRSIL